MSLLFITEANTWSVSATINQEEEVVERGT